jgi:hypothetical protein
MPGADKRLDRLTITLMDAHSLRDKLEQIGARPGDDDLRQQIETAVEALRAVERGLVDAMRREFPQSRTAHRRAKGKPVKPRGITWRRWF